MKKKIIIRLLVLIQIPIFLLAGCGEEDSGSDDLLSLLKHQIPPKSIIPENGSSINTDQKIVVTFNQTLASFDLIGGAMLPESNNGVITTTENLDDTVTIRPLDRWQEGDNRDLIIKSKNADMEYDSTFRLFYRIDGTAPICLSVSPLSDSTIGGYTPVVIVFNESMNAEDYRVEGSMAFESDMGKWSKTKHENDTLTISPSVKWAHREERSLRIECEDIVRNEAQNISLIYNVSSKTPGVNIYPPNDKSINTTEFIAILFTTTPMNHSSFRMVAQGNNPMAADSHTLNWNPEEDILIELFGTLPPAEDILLLGPAAEWKEGPDRNFSFYCEDIVGNPVEYTRTYTVDIVSEYTVDPPAAFIQNTRVIRILFTEPMDNNVYVFESSLDSNKSSHAWSAERLGIGDYDTFTITPNPTWPVHDSIVSFNLDCQDIFGNEVDTIRLVFTIDMEPPVYGFRPKTNTDDVVEVYTVENVFTLSASANIEIEFDETMNRDSLEISSAIYSDDYPAHGIAEMADIIIDSSAGYDNNYLVLKPDSESPMNGKWLDGSEMDLKLCYEDVAGNVIDNTLYFNVDAVIPGYSITEPPPGDNTLHAYESIKIEFTEKMKNSEGAISFNSGYPVYNSDFTYNWDDECLILTLMPVDKWPEKDGINYQGAISLICEDDAGDADLSDEHSIHGNQAEIDLFYTIDPFFPTVDLIDPDPDADDYPYAGNFIPGNQEIVITFSEEIDAGSLESDGSTGFAETWESNSSLVGNTLTLTPNTSWVEGGGIISIMCEDIAGNKLDDNNLYTKEYIVDNTPPTSIIDSPRNDSFVRGDSLNIEVNADDKSGSGINRVEFYVNSALTKQTQTSPYSIVWNTTTAPDEDYLIYARSYDNVGNYADSDEITLKVDNTRPTSAIVSPKDDIFVGGSSVMITADAGDEGSGIDRVEFYVDSALIGQVTGSPYSITWDTATASDEGHSIYATAYDIAGNSTDSDAITLKVDNTGPVISIELPSDDAVINESSVTIVTDPSDKGIGVKSVEFFVNLASIGQVTVSPYTIAWVTASVRAGSYEIYAVACDNLDNCTKSSVVAIRKFDGIVFVSKANNTGREHGTKDYPYNTIQEAVDFAGIELITPSLFSSVDIYVAEGAYNETVTLRDKVSLYGGYNSENWSYENMTTAIKSSTGDSTIIGNSAVSNDTIIDGFTIYGPDVNDSCAIFNTGGSSPTIQNNIIGGGSITVNSNTDSIMTGIKNVDSSPIIYNNIIDGGISKNTPTLENSDEYDCFSYGIYNLNSSPTIENNKINGGNAEADNRESDSFTYGIYNENCDSMIIQNNVVFGGAAKAIDRSGGSDENSTSYGIFNDDSYPEIRNNTISGGLCSSNDLNKCYGIYIESSSPGTGSEIENNIIVAQSVDDSYGIFEAADNGDPAAVRNNNIYCYGGVIYVDEGSVSVANLSTSISTGQGTETLGYWNNVNVDPLFDDIDDGWSLSLDTPVYVKFGGLIGSNQDPPWGFSDDLAGVERTALPDVEPTYGWSMGAYEFLSDPSVSSVIPINNSYINILTQSNPIIITFNQPMDFRTSGSALDTDYNNWIFMDTGSITGTLVSDIGSMSWNDNYTTLSIYPLANWTQGNFEPGGNSRDITFEDDFLHVWNDLFLANDVVLDYIVDLQRPTGSESPANQSTIYTNTSISITFNEDMNTSDSAKTITGDILGDESDGGVWSTDARVLTISPDDGSWQPTIGVGMTQIIITCEDTAGNTYSESFKYNIDNIP